MIDLPTAAKKALDEALSRQGLRSTRQREHIFAILLHWRDHPSADEVYARARKTNSTMSLATVYNCLETLVKSGLVRAVNYERTPTRYCPNLSEHAHFQDKDSGRVYDIDLPSHLLAELRAYLPEDFEAEDMELYFLGSLKSEPKATAPQFNTKRSKS